MRKVALIMLVLSLFLSPKLYCQEKRALLIGIGNYPSYGEWNKIHGDNDVEMIREWLNTNGFPEKNIISLVNNEATFTAIGDAFKKLILLAGKNDVIYIQFSGHGQQITDLDGDESDGWDECWIPYDAYKRYLSDKYTGQNHLSDDVLYDYLAKLRGKIGVGGKIIVISDSCHSGSGSRSEDEFCRGTGDKFIIPTDAKTLGGNKQGNKAVKWLYVAACKAYQTNYEYKMSNGSYCGSLTYIIANEIRDISKVSYIDLIKGWKIQQQNISKYPQSIEEEGEPNKHSNTIF